MVNPDDPGSSPLTPSDAPAINAGAIRSEPLPIASAPTNDGRGRNYVEWAVIILVAVGFAFLVRGFAFQTFFIPSESMVPRLETDDRSIAALQKLDQIVFARSKRLVVKFCIRIDVEHFLPHGGMAVDVIGNDAEALECRHRIVITLFVVSSWFGISCGSRAPWMRSA